MKGFTISELLIYDPTKKPQKKAIQIQIQQAKIIAYYPSNAEYQQKCNTVGMAQGVYDFCHTLLIGKQTTTQEQKRQKGWQTIYMNNCTLILSEVEQNIWIFVKLEHKTLNQYHRIGEVQENSYYSQSFTQNTCKIFMDTLYNNFKMFYGNIRSWVFNQYYQSLQAVLTLFIIRFQQIYKYQNQNTLNMISFMMKDIRIIPLDVNTTLKFTYFKNVLQSYNSNIAHVIVFAHGILTYTSLGKNTTQMISKYLFSNGEPYFYSEQHKHRVNMLRQLPKNNQKQKYGLIYNSKVVGFQQIPESYRLTMAPPKVQGVDLLGLQSQNSYDFFDIYIEEQESPMKVNFYAENNMFFVTLFKTKPEMSEIFFQNRFYHDNADKFISKINESIPSILKPADPYKFMFHNCATYTGKSTIKQWKNTGYHIRNTLELMQKYPEGTMATSTQNGYWIYGVHRLSRILIILIPMENSLGKLQEYVGKMTKEYFSKAFL